MSTVCKSYLIYLTFIMLFIDTVYCTGARAFLSIVHVLLSIGIVHRYLFTLDALPGLADVW